MSPSPPMPGCPAVSSAVAHALGWLVAGNAVGLYLALLLLNPTWQLGQFSYGRWVPVHLNVQLYGWTSLPLVALLFAIYEVDRSSVKAWGPATVWAWTSALAAGVCQWLNGITSGKIFLDWRGGALWALLAALTGLWCLLAMAWNDRSAAWTPWRRRLTLAGLLALALVPTTILFTASPSTYPPIDRTTGGPTGSSLLGSSLVVVGLMLMLPRVAAAPRRGGPRRGVWWFFTLSWLVFGVIESMGGTHHDIYQIVSLWFLLPWVWWLPHDWAGFSWPAGTRLWRLAAVAWWGMLVLSGLWVYQPGVLDRLKFSQGLVAHSHLAMAGFTTSFCALLLVLLTRRRLGPAVTVATWQLAALGMVSILAVMGWREGIEPSWMVVAPPWRTLGLHWRAVCGGLMLVVSLRWWWERRTLAA